MYSWEYGDPEKVAIRKQEEFLRKERACGRCVHKIQAVIGAEVLIRCEFKNREYGIKCDLYKVKKAITVKGGANEK